MEKRGSDNKALHFLNSRRTSKRQRCIDHMVLYFHFHVNIKSGDSLSLAQPRFSWEKDGRMLRLIKGRKRLHFAPRRNRSRSVKL